MTAEFCCDQYKCDNLGMKDRTCVALGKRVWSYFNRRRKTTDSTKLIKISFDGAGYPLKILTADKKKVIKKNKNPGKIYAGSPPPYGTALPPARALAIHSK